MENGLNYKVKLKNIYKIFIKYMQFYLKHAKHVKIVLFLKLFFNDKYLYVSCLKSLYRWSKKFKHISTSLHFISLLALINH